VKPVKSTKEDTDKFAESITTTTPQGDNLEAGINDTASLTAIEEETHPPDPDWIDRRGVAEPEEPKE
jgi:hypothetical protein